MRDRDAWAAHLADRGFNLDGDPPPRPSRVQTERTHLRNLFKAAALRWWRPYAFHIANERASPQERNALRGCGIAAGLPDVWLILPRPPHWGCIVELKAGADVTPAQEAWIGVLTLAGAVTSLAQGWAAAFATLDAYAGAQRPTDPPPPLPDHMSAIATALVANRAGVDARGGGVGAGESVSRGGGGDPLSGK